MLGFNTAVGFYEALYIVGKAMNFDETTDSIVLYRKIIYEISMF